MAVICHDRGSTLPAWRQYSANALAVRYQHEGSTSDKLTECSLLAM
ncbi:MAG: hypothetical protein IJB28_09020 [Bacteroidaceae bacterium]|nr:hypothetical protein [Bacteroidaceae bacterium]